MSCVVHESTISPIVADVTIGFEPSQYTVFETQGFVILSVGVLDGDLQGSVNLMFTTVDDSATCELVHVVDQILSAIFDEYF